MLIPTSVFPHSKIWRHIPYKGKSQFLNFWISLTPLYVPSEGGDPPSPGVSLGAEPSHCTTRLIYSGCRVLQGFSTHSQQRVAAKHKGRLTGRLAEGGRGSVCTVPDCHSQLCCYKVYIIYSLKFSFVRRKQYILVCQICFYDNY